MKEGLNFEEKKEIPKEEKISKLKGIESFRLTIDQDVVMQEMNIPEPVLKNNNKPKIVYTRKKDSIF
jgi:hypothetical protein